MKGVSQAIGRAFLKEVVDIYQAEVQINRRAAANVYSNLCDPSTKDEVMTILKRRLSEKRRLGELTRFVQNQIGGERRTSVASGLVL